MSETINIILNDLGITIDKGILNAGTWFVLVLIFAFPLLAFLMLPLTRIFGKNAVSLVMAVPILIIIVAVISMFSSNLRPKKLG